jgi:hypothetical protein
MKKLTTALVVVAFAVLPQCAAANAPSHPSRTFEGQVEFTDDKQPDEKVGGVIIDWNHWRNEVLHAAWTKWGERLEGGLSLGSLKISMGNQRGHNFPSGTSATFSCTITREGHVQHLVLTQPSGDAEFDKLVLASVRSLQNSRVLSFPNDSQRQSVEQSGTFRIGKTAFREAQFGDVEHAATQ